MLADKAGTYMGGAPQKTQLWWLALYHTNKKKYARVEVICSGKQSNLLRYSNNYSARIVQGTRYDKIDMSLGQQCKLLLGLFAKA